MLLKVPWRALHDLRSYLLYFIEQFEVEKAIAFFKDQPLWAQLRQLCWCCLQDQVALFDDYVHFLLTVCPDWSQEAGLAEKSAFLGFGEPFRPPSYDLHTLCSYLQAQTSVSRPG